MPEQILSAARALLDEMPARDISVRELARSASVSHAAPYRHFGDRHGFLAALAAECFREFVEAQRTAANQAPTGQSLLAVGEAYVNYAIAVPFAFELIFDPNINPANQPPSAFEPLIAEHSAVLASALADAAKNGRLLPAGTPEDVGAAMWSVAHGLAGLVISHRIPAERVSEILATLVSPAN